MPSYKLKGDIIQADRWFAPTEAGSDFNHDTKFYKASEQFYLETNEGPILLEEGCYIVTFESGAKDVYSGHDFKRRFELIPEIETEDEAKSNVEAKEQLKKYDSNTSTKINPPRRSKISRLPNKSKRRSIND
jgi:hypothetical protein